MPLPPSPPALTVVIPAHDEAERIVASIRAIQTYAETAGLAHETLVVDDGSSDGTGQRIEQEFADRVKVLRHARCRGKGAASRTGVLAATGAHILLVDADLPVSIAELRRFLAAAERASIVIASKYAPGSSVDYPALRRLGSFAGQIVIRSLVVGGFRDTQCGFKLFERSVARALFATSRLDGYGFDFEVLFLARRFGFLVSELPVQVVHRAEGNVRLSSYLRTLAEVGRIVWYRMTAAYPRSLCAVLPAPPEEK